MRENQSDNALDLLFLDRRFSVLVQNVENFCYNGVNGGVMALKKQV